MEFFECAAQWGERRSVPVSFYRDYLGDWFARASYSDANGSFNAQIPAMSRIPARAMRKGKNGKPDMPAVPQETLESFEVRVEKAMADATVKVRRGRIGMMQEAA